MVVDRHGDPRNVPAFPDGVELEDGGSFAATVDDYRHLYRTFLSDPDLQAARARFPFVCIWDDHEFTDDGWQTQANYSRENSTDEPSQTRRVAANQAWFEYVPAILSEADDADGVAKAARDFEPVEVEDAPYTDVIEVDEPNNQKALDSITIYRRLRFGKHVDLVLTDNRLYRSDHAIAEESTANNLVIFHPRAAVPLEAVNAFDAGRDAPGGAPEMVLGIPNTRMDSPPGTILGPEQKQWWKDVMAASDATFKVWGNSLPLVRIRLDASGAPIFPGDLVLSADSWDGYPSERRELMTYLRDQGIRNVVSLSGDHHAHFAGLVHDDFDAEDQTPVMVDFAAAGISSTSQWSAVAGAVATAVGPNPTGALLDVRKLIYYDATEVGGEGKAKVNLNTVILYGSPAGNVAAQTDDLAMIEAARNPDVNPHLRYVDTAANGYGLATFDGSGARVALVTTEQPIFDRGDDGIEVIGTAEFEVPVVAEGEVPTLDAPELTGKKPFPLE
jgi:alkaline phosphatase D